MTTNSVYFMYKKLFPKKINTTIRNVNKFENVNIFVIINMWRFILISTCVLLGAMNSKAAARHVNKRGAGSYSGSFASTNGGTGGYVGNFNDYDDYNYAPNFGFGFIDPFVFHQQLTAHILAQHAAQQNAIASTFSMGDATVTADASNLPNEIPDYDEQNAAFFDNIRRQNHYSYKGNKGNRYAPNFSAAAASVGPGGGYQTAFINPENPSIPNISNRFSSVSPSGFKGVSVSSYSSSSDINGKKTSHRGAQTTINDNGRITTYKVNS